MMRRVILPGAFRRALPAYSNEVIFMLHSSVVLSTITLQDIHLPRDVQHRPVLFGNAPARGHSNLFYVYALFAIHTRNVAIGS